MEDGIEQVLALALLLACDSRREARLGSLSVSRNSLQAAGFCDLMVRFYRGDGAGGLSVPIGMLDDGPVVEVVPPMIASVLDRRGRGGAPLYSRGIEGFNDTADPVAVVRNALTAQPDQNAVVVLAGPPDNLLGLLSLPDGDRLARDKARALVVASPAERASGFAELRDAWPGPLVLAGDELDLRYSGAAIEEDFAWAGNHPVIDAYRSAPAAADGASAHAMAAVLYAVRSDGGYSDLSGGEAGVRGTARRLTADALKRGRAVRAIRERVGAPPPARGRGRGR